MVVKFVGEIVGVYWFVILAKFACVVGVVLIFVSSGNMCC